jgi:hypothetical protein
MSLAAEKTSFASELAPSAIDVFQRAMDHGG